MFAYFLLAHLVADFAFQPLWLVRRKRRWDGLLIHMGIVLLCMLPIPLCTVATPGLWLALGLISAIHLAADRWKITIGDRLFRSPLAPFLLDQAIHLGTLTIVLSLCLPGELVWGLDAVPYVREILMGAGYLVAAVATPIGVIVALDPQFAHAALAGSARLRALLCGAITLALTLVGGAIAVPATLFGLTFVLRRPASAHPLDSAPGLAIVLAIAASLGWALRLLSA